MSYTLPEPTLYAHELIQNKGGVWLGVDEAGICEKSHTPGETGDEVIHLFSVDQMQAAYEAGRASRDAEVDKLKLKAELLKVALETSEGYLKQEREEVEALEKFRNEVINATGNKALADWIEKHGRPVPMQQEIDTLQAEVEALQARAMAYERDIEKFATECAKHGLHDRSPEAAVNLLAFERDNLQAQIAEQDHELADTAFLAGQYKAERDAALAKLKELEAQEPVGAVLQSATNYDSTWSFICSSKQHLKTGIPIYTRPIPAQPTARTYMDGYSDGKKWALDRTLTYAEIDALCVGERLTIPQYSARIKIARAIEAKLKEGL